MWGIMRPIRVVVVVVILYRSLKMGPLDCHENSVRKNRYRLRNIPEERTPRLLRGGSPKLRRFRPYVPYFTCHLILLIILFLLSRCLGEINQNNATQRVVRVCVFVCVT